MHGPTLVGPFTKAESRSGCQTDNDRWQNNEKSLFDPTARHDSILTRNGQRDNEALRLRSAYLYSCFPHGPKLTKRLDGHEEQHRILAVDASHERGNARIRVGPDVT